MTHKNTLSVQQITEYLLWKSREDKKPITNKKLQKLLYYSQAWSLVLRQEKLFNEKIQAWVHGPAIPEVYLEYKKFGSDPIVKNADEKLLSTIPNDIKTFLDQVWSVYGKYDAAYLEYLSHSESPWQKAREGLAPHIGSENEITLESMKVFYTSLAKSKTKTV